MSKLTRHTIGCQTVQYHWYSSTGSVLSRAMIGVARLRRDSSTIARRYIPNMFRSDVFFLIFSARDLLS